MNSNPHGMTAWHGGGGPAQGGGGWFVGPYGGYPGTYNGPPGPPQQGWNGYGPSGYGPYGGYVSVGAHYLWRESESELMFVV